jgi:hypothetical protein
MTYEPDLPNLRQVHLMHEEVFDELALKGFKGTVNFDAASDDHKGDLQSSPLIPRMKRRIGLPEAGSGWGFPS